MRLDDIRFLFAYDRWATRRILGVIEGADEAVWGATGVVGDRGLGAILVHQLGAYQRWRHGLSGSGRSPRPEREPLPTPGSLAAAWPAEWEAMDAWLDGRDAVYVVEQNRDGQLANIFRETYPEFATKFKSVLHYNGHAIDAKGIVDQITAFEQK